MNTQSFLSHMQSVTWYLSVPGYVFPQKIWSSLSLPECPKLSINRKWFSNNWKKKKKKKKKKKTLLGNSRKGFEDFLGKVTAGFEFSEKGYVEQQLDGVFHAAAGIEVGADDATLRFFCAFIWFRLMGFFFFPRFWFVWIELQVPVAFWNFLVLELIWFLFVMKNLFLEFSWFLNFLLLKSILTCIDAECLIVNSWV